MLPMSFREACRLALPAESRKSIAFDAFPGHSSSYQRVELSRVLAGERRPSWELVESLLRAGAATPLVKYVRQASGEAADPLQRAVEQLSDELVELRSELRELRAHRSRG